VGTTSTLVASTVPGNGDVNPYGVAIVPRSIGTLHQGDVLVSNFNAASNLQGTGTTIVQIAPNGKVGTFAQINPAHLPGPCPGGVGLTTALVVLSSGWVVVGSLPTSDGTAATAKDGCLLVLDDHGKARETITGHGINGPWDMTALDLGQFAELFATNVLNGTVAADGATVDHGTVVRLILAAPGDQPPSVLNSTVIGSGFGEHRPGRARDRTDRTRPVQPGDPVRRRQRRQQDHRHPERALADQRRGYRPHRDRGRRARWRSLRSCRCSPLRCRSARLRWRRSRRGPDDQAGGATARVEHGGLVSGPLTSRRAS
jgi:hypothetical protein